MKMLKCLILGGLLLSGSAIAQQALLVNSSNLSQDITYRFDFFNPDVSRVHGDPITVTIAASEHFVIAFPSLPSQYNSMVMAIMSATSKDAQGNIIAQGVYTSSNDNKGSQCEGSQFSYQNKANASFSFNGAPAGLILCKESDYENDIQ